MEKLLNVENGWDGDVDCSEVMGLRCLILEEEVASAIKGLKIRKAADVVSEMMKASGYNADTYILVRKPEQNSPSLQSMEGHLQTSMEGGSTTTTT